MQRCRYDPPSIAKALAERIHIIELVLVGCNLFINTQEKNLLLSLAFNCAMQCEINLFRDSN